MIRRVRVAWRNYRFERSAMIPVMPDRLLALILDQEVVFPPRRFLMQPSNQTIEGRIRFTDLIQRLPLGVTSIR